MLNATISPALSRNFAICNAFNPPNLSKFLKNKTQKIKPLDPIQKYNNPILKNKYTSFFLKMTKLLPLAFSLTFSYGYKHRCPYPLDTIEHRLHRCPYTLDPLEHRLYRLIAHAQWYSTTPLFLSVYKQVCWQTRVFSSNKRFLRTTTTRLVFHP